MVAEKVTDRHYLFIIHTDSYIYNVERQMCCYITGHIGDCGIGNIYKKLYEQEETEEFTNVIKRCHHDRCCRPCKVWCADNKETGEVEYNSVAIYFGSPPTQIQIDIIMRRAAKFPETHRGTLTVLPSGDFSYIPIKILGFSLLEIKQVETEVEMGAELPL